MNSKFQPDTRLHQEPELVDPEAYDASELQFAASVDNLSTAAPKRFVPDEVTPPISVSIDSTLAADQPNPAPADETSLEGKESAERCPENFQNSMPESNASWRNEVAERVNQYRRRSPRQPRYPSLQLKFESSQPLWTSPRMAEVPPVARQAVALEREVELTSALPTPVVPSPVVSPAIRANTETVGRLIEFPRFAVEPSRVDELAEPVQNHLRIIEAPEVAPAPPALGGILIEPAEERVEERRPGFEFPLQSASLARRISAALVDGLIVLIAVGLFGFVSYRLAAPVLPLVKVVGIGVLLAGLFWLAYQYLLLVHTGSTPGLKIARLRIARFDGVAVPRALRRWRVLTSALSALSLCLGYLWCFLDEDRLCWHDRITKTHLAPRDSSAHN